MIATLLLAALLPLPPAGDPAADLARAAREARRAGEAAQALAILETGAPSLLSDLRVAGERIQALLDAGRVSEATEVHAALGAVSAGPPPFGIARMRLQIAVGQPVPALAWAESAKAALGDNPDFLAACIEAQAAQRRWSEADRALQRLPEGFPAPLRLRLEVDLALAQARELAQDPDLVERAIPLLERALQLAPARDDVKVELVVALAQWHRPERAEALAREVLGRTEGAARADMLYALGTVLRAELRDAEAAECFEQVMALQPDHPRAPTGLARCRLRAGREAEALDLLARRLAADPHDPEALLLRAEHALEQRDASVAVASLRTVLDRYPQHLKALYMLSRALALQGRIEEQAEVLATWKRKRDELAMK